MSGQDVITSGAPERPERPRWGGRRGAVGLAAVVVGAAALGITGLASADTSPAPTPSSAPDDAAVERAPGPFNGRPGPGMGRRHGPGFGPGGALHGEFVVRKGEGEYQTIATQRGEVTKVSPTSITLKSEDGYSRTYVVTEDTVVNAARDGIDTVEVGDTAHVLALVEDGKATAVRISDGTKVRAGMGRLRPAEPDPQPSASAASLSS